MTAILRNNCWGISSNPLDATASSTAAGGETVNNIFFIGGISIPYILNALQEILCNLQF